MADFDGWADIGKNIGDAIRLRREGNAQEGLVDLLANGAPAAPAAQQAMPAPPAAPAPQAAAASPQAAPTPADQNFDLAARTVIGEAGNQGPQGMAAVAHVIKNRSDQSGLAPGQVVLAPGQFEPWGNPQTRAKLASIDPNSPEYQQALAIVKATWGGQLPDPTGGATHFFAPKAQAALGRDEPAWAQGQSGQDIGDQRFYKLGYTTSGGAPQQAPQAQAQPQGQPQAQQPQAAPQGGSLNPELADKLKAMIHAGGASRQYAQAIMEKYIAPKYGFQSTPDGTIVRTNPNTGAVEPVYQSNKPEFKQVSVDRNGNPVYGTVDLAHGTITPYSPQGNASGQGSDNLATGDDFLKTMDAGRAAEVKAIVEGRMAPPGGMSLKSPQVQGLLRDAAQYDPGFDLTLWKSRNDMLSSARSGKIGQNVASFNTTIQHLDKLDQSIDNLNNTGFSDFNNWANYLGNKGYLPGSDKIQKSLADFETDRQAAVAELTRAFRGSGGSASDVADWNQKLSSAASPAALHQAVKSAVELLRGRIEAVGDQYNRGMATKVPKDATDFLSPGAKATLLRLSGEAPAETAPAPGAQPQAPAVAPPQISRVTNRDDANAAIGQAKAAIAAGAPRAAVIQRLQQMGVPPAGL